MSGDGSAWPDEWEHANSEAYLALGALRAEPAKLLANFLLSDVPISRYVREAMARALLGEQYEGCLGIELVGVGQGPTSPSGRRKARRDLEIGRWVQAQMSQRRISQQKAWVEASDHFPLSDAGCRDAFRFTVALDKWVTGVEAMAMPRSAQRAGCLRRSTMAPTPVLGLPCDRGRHAAPRSARPRSGGLPPA